jgi:uncharacterized membrane protein YhaH (DUF805 family)
MQATQYRIVFDGELMPGMAVETVKANLARLFKSDADTIDRLFQQDSVNIKRELSETQADKYLRALQAAGAKVRKEPEPNPALSLALMDSAEVTPLATAHMECPKCGHAQAQAIQCESCGIVIEKYLARQAQNTAPKALHELNHPYAPPRAQVAEPTPEFGELKPFSVHGRIGRLRYLAWSMILSLSALGLLVVGGGIFAFSSLVGLPVMGLIVIGFLVVTVQLGVQRLHDIGWSGWLILLTLIPVIGSIFPFVMLLAPGSKGLNRFGPPPPPNSRAVKILAVLWLLVPIIGIFAAIALPAYQSALWHAPF